MAYPKIAEAMEGLSCRAFRPSRALKHSGLLCSIPSYSKAILGRSLGG